MDVSGCDILYLANKTHCSYCGRNDRWHAVLAGVHGPGVECACDGAEFVAADDLPDQFPMKQSGFGISSCLTFAAALALGCTAWFIISGMRPTRPINHMDMGAGVTALLVAGGFGALILIIAIVGLALGIVGLRQTTRGRLAAKIGTAFNGLGLLGIVALAVRQFIAR